MGVLPDEVGTECTLLYCVLLAHGGYQRGNTRSPSQVHTYISVSEHHYHGNNSEFPLGGRPVDVPFKVSVEEDGDGIVAKRMAVLASEGEEIRFDPDYATFPQRRDMILGSLRPGIGTDSSGKSSIKIFC